MLVMKMNKILIKVYVPMLSEVYDVWVPYNKKIYEVIIALKKAIKELSDGDYSPIEMPSLYDKLSSVKYSLDLELKDTTLENGTEVILI